MTQNKHPSYAIIGWNRITGGNADLFMSPLKHQNCVEIKIYHATRETWSGGEVNASPSPFTPFLTLRMSELQFSRFITSPGMGHGTPCTLTRKDRDPIPSPPREDLPGRFKQALHDLNEDTTSRLDALQEQLDALLEKGRAGKGDLDALRKNLDIARGRIATNLPFVASRYEEAMTELLEDTVSQFEGHVQARLQEMGLEHLRKSDPPALINAIDVSALPED